MEQNGFRAAELGQQSWACWHRMCPCPWQIKCGTFCGFFPWRELPFSFWICILRHPYCFVDLVEMLQVVLTFPCCCLPSLLSMWSYLIRLDKQTFHSVLLLLGLFWQRFHWGRRAECHNSSYNLITEHLCLCSDECNLTNCNYVCLFHIRHV